MHQFYKLGVDPIHRLVKKRRIVTYEALRPNMTYIRIEQDGKFLVMLRNDALKDVFALLGRYDTIPPSQ